MGRQGTSEHPPVVRESSTREAPKGRGAVFLLNKWGQGRQMLETANHCQTPPAKGREGLRGQRWLRSLLAPPRTPPQAELVEAAAAGD